MGKTIAIAYPLPEFLRSGHSITVHCAYSIIVDQLAALIIALLAQISGSRENARVSIGKTFAGLG